MLKAIGGYRKLKVIAGVVPTSFGAFPGLYPRLKYLLKRIKCFLQN